MFALSFLVLVPFAVWAGLELGPTSFDSFIDNVESSGAVGSAYWSLFGRGDNCCHWVPHVGTRVQREYAMSADGNDDRTTALHYIIERN